MTKPELYSKLIGKKAKKNLNLNESIILKMYINFFVILIILTLKVYLLNCLLSDHPCKYLT